MFAFPCPHCSTPLRVRDQAFRGRTIPCPDCGKSVLIEDRGGVLTGVVADNPQTSASIATLPRRSRTPQLIGGGIAALLACGFAIFLFFAGATSRQPTAGGDPSTPVVEPPTENSPPVETAASIAKALPETGVAPPGNAAVPA